MRIFEDKYPVGTFPKQVKAGIHCDDLLYGNLKELARAIVQDNSFLFLVSSQALSVRTGKSTFVQHMAEAWNHIMLKEYGIKLDFDMRNLAFDAEDFEKKAFGLHDRGQKYAPVILDESDDLTGHSLSAEVKKIKRFLRKSGQLNLLMIMILPDFFEFPKPIAVNRSIALITVDYGERFQRGSFSFFDFKAKKKMYIRGKQYNDYSVVEPTFRGEFSRNYLVDEKEYRKQKYRDLLEDAQKQRAKRIEIQKLDMLSRYFTRCVKQLKGRIPKHEIVEIFEITAPTADAWMRRQREKLKGTLKDDNNIPPPEDEPSPATDTEQNEPEND